MKKILLFVIFALLAPVALASSNFDKIISHSIELFVQDEARRLHSSENTIYVSRQGIPESVENKKVCFISPEQYLWDKQWRKTLSKGTVIYKLSYSLSENSLFVDVYEWYYQRKKHKMMISRSPDGNRVAHYQYAYSNGEWRIVSKNNAEDYNRTDIYWGSDTISVRWSIVELRSGNNEPESLLPYPREKYRFTIKANNSEAQVISLDVQDIVGEKIKSLHGLPKLVEIVCGNDVILVSFIADIDGVSQYITCSLYCRKDIITR